MSTQTDILSRMLSPKRLADTMETKISMYLRRKSGVTMVELARDIPGFKGDETWGREDQNIILWADMSTAAIAAMKQLLAAEKIVPTPTSWLVYNFDGAVLDMPIAESVAKRYAKPHWLPVVFAGAEDAA